MRSWEHESDERAALVCREIVNSNPWRSGPPAKISDFMPQKPLPPSQKERLMKAEFHRAMKNWPKPKASGKA